MYIAKSTVNIKSFSATSRKRWKAKCRSGTNGGKGAFLFLSPFCWCYRSVLGGVFPVHFRSGFDVFEY